MLKEKVSYKTVSDCLDVFVNQIAKTSALVSEPGLLTGKTGIAILLYHYAHFKNDMVMREYADLLIDIVVREIIADEDFDGGLYGIIWGIDYLIKQNFLEVEEDIFVNMDTEILNKEKSKELNLVSAFEAETEKGLYIWNRLHSYEPSARDEWWQRIANCVGNIQELLKLRYISYSLPVFSCKSFIRFFHLGALLQKAGYCTSEIEALNGELAGILKISFEQEKSVSDKYILALLLADVPKCKKILPFEYITKSLTLTDLNNLYITRLILAQNFILPQIAEKTLLSIVSDNQRIEELLFLYNTNNAGLGNYVGGLAWAMLQWCIRGC